ncbi:DUF4476 domain-containing protein [Corallococcus sp. AB004]|uniref:DUF4476 domain-containing protein n=1 Tax=Corallococcus sp. AB038B TaxID=2316718 RepID=UPI000EA2241E|nr:DUF4476 domain-containing protein [Corallococcus sp. AB038B]RKI05242.1 DUF4476 domain-containing protein [Corallococcus sp. AB038B]RKI32334.1 DUF4476 domain-containing protein [Corallococcus sp. AB004]
MNRIVRAALVSSLFVSSASFAQDAEFNMQVDINDQDMPSARIKMKTTTNVDGEETTTVKVRGGGARMDVQMTGGTTESESYSETRTTETRREPRMHSRPEMPVAAEAAPSHRDCGTRSDEGCMMRRDGQYPMDASTWSGFYQSLKSENNEIVRQEKADKMLKRVYLTAMQFGMVLDLFKNEIVRLDVARIAAPHVVDPQHALGFSSKWRNSISGSEYTDIITQ